MKFIVVEGEIEFKQEEGSKVNNMTKIVMTEDSMKIKKSGGFETSNKCSYCTLTMKEGTIFKIDNTNNEDWAVFKVENKKIHVPKWISNVGDITNIHTSCIVKTYIIKVNILDENDTISPKNNNLPSIHITLIVE